MTNNCNYYLRLGSTHGFCKGVLFVYATLSLLGSFVAFGKSEPIHPKDTTPPFNAFPGIGAGNISGGPAPMTMPFDGYAGGGGGNTVYNDGQPLTNKVPEKSKPHLSGGQQSALFLRNFAFNKLYNKLTQYYLSNGHTTMPVVEVEDLDFLNDNELKWLAESQYGSELLSAVAENGFAEDAQKALTITIQVGRSGALNDPGPHAWAYQFLRTLNPWFEPSIEMIADMEAQVAILKVLNPNWTKLLCYYEVLNVYLHFGLDVAGLVPLVGEGFDMLNGVLYTWEGDKLNAVTSFGSSLPVGGWAAAGAKWAFAAGMFGRAGRGGKGILKWVIKQNGLIDFGSEKQLTYLRKGLARASQQTFRIIPWRNRNHPLVQAAAHYRIDPFHLNELDNGIEVAGWRFAQVTMGSRTPKFDNRVGELLDQAWGNIKDLPSIQQMNLARGELDKLQRIFKAQLDRYPELTIDELPF